MTTTRGWTVRIGERTYITGTYEALEPGCVAALVRSGSPALFGRWWPARDARRPYLNMSCHGEFAEFADYLARDGAMKKPIPVPAGATIMRATGIQTVMPYAVDVDLPRWRGPGPGVGPTDRISKREWNKREAERVALLPA